MSIHDVSDDMSRAGYHSGMEKVEQQHEQDLGREPPPDWRKWGARFREAVKEQEKKYDDIGATMKPPRVESSIRSWTNGTRKINLVEFFELCRAADVDPAMILFGRPLMTVALQESLTGFARKVIESDPASSPTYGKFGDNIRKSVRARKAAESRAASRLKTK